MLNKMVPRLNPTMRAMAEIAVLGEQRFCCGDLLGCHDWGPPSDSAARSGGVEAFAGAFEPSEDITLLAQYMWSDPARWQDWQTAVRRALTDDGAANPEQEGRWQERPEWPHTPRAD